MMTGLIVAIILLTYIAIPVGIAIAWKGRGRRYVASVLFVGLLTPAIGAVGVAALEDTVLHAVIPSSLAVGGVVLGTAIAAGLLFEEVGPIEAVVVQSNTIVIFLLLGPVLLMTVEPTTAPPGPHLEADVAVEIGRCTTVNGTGMVSAVAQNVGEIPLSPEKVDIEIMAGGEVNATLSTTQQPFNGSIRDLNVTDPGAGWPGPGSSAVYTYRTARFEPGREYTVRMTFHEPEATDTGMCYIAR